MLELQTDLIDSGMRVVAPLVPVSDSPKPIGRLQPVFEINGAAHVLHTAELAAIPSTLIKSALVADLSDRVYETAEPTTWYFPDSDQLIVTIEKPESRGLWFRSLNESIDTTTSEGVCCSISSGPLPHSSDQSSASERRRPYLFSIIQEASEYQRFSQDWCVQAVRAGGSSMQIGKIRDKLRRFS